ncbi:MAG: hypothetical protein IPG52_02630 [Rhodocyclaceae bacterium]|nr:hypothetical protein [Rhodocyclaceae bacterium]
MTAGRDLKPSATPLAAAVGDWMEALAHQIEDFHRRSAGDAGRHRSPKSCACIPRKPATPGVITS